MSWGATRCNVVDVRGWPYTKSTGGPYVYRWFFNVDAIRLEAYEHHSSLAAVSFQRQRDDAVGHGQGDRAQLLEGFIDDIDAGA